jgi:hypothetical protein
MASKNGQVRGGLPVETFAQPIWGKTHPLDQQFSYHASGVNIQDEDLKDYLQEPIAALPPAVRQRLGVIHVVFVPYLETGEGGQLVVTDQPPDKENAVAAARVERRDQQGTMLLFAMQEPNLGDLHYHFFRWIGRLVADLADDASLEAFGDLLVSELNEPFHGEVDDESWRLKQDLYERDEPVTPGSPGFREYARTAFGDTLTLYLHGLCCDIDVEPGPRQLPSRPLRRRLELLEQIYRPPQGYSVFPPVE